METAEFRKMIIGVFYPTERFLAHLQYAMMSTL